jgi:hypothetical protein
VYINYLIVENVLIQYVYKHLAIYKSASLLKEIFTTVEMRIPTKISRMSFQHKIHTIRNKHSLTFLLPREERVSMEGYKLQKRK